MANDLSESDPRIIDALKGLTGKQAAFALIIAKEPTIAATQAHIKAGYTGTYNSHGVEGFKCLRNPKIVKAVTIIREIIGSYHKLSADKVLADLETTRLKAITKGDLATATRCSELQGKTLALFADKQIVEDPAKARELDEKEAEEAKRIAQIRLRDCG